MTTKRFNVQTVSVCLERPNRPDVRAEVVFLNGMIYVWLGRADTKPLSNLQIAYPSMVFLWQLVQLLSFLHLPHSFLSF